MKLNIKSLLTGTTLFVASVFNINAVPPKGIKLIDGATVTHLIFGAMKVISHRDDLDFYQKNVEEDPEEDSFGYFDDKGQLAENFIKYVLDADSLKQANIPQDDIVNFVAETCNSQAGMAALKVITANYLREYDRIKQFCEEHKEELKACYEFSRTEEGKEFYEKERQIFELEEKLGELLKCDIAKWSESNFSKLEISSNDLKNLYEYFRREEEVFNNELKESWTQLQKKDSEFFKWDYAFVLYELYKHSLGKNDNKNDNNSNNESNDDGDSLSIGVCTFGLDSERYKKLQNFVLNHKVGFEKFFNIGHLHLAGNLVKRGSVKELDCRKYYLKYKKDLSQLLQLRQEEVKLLETAKSVTEIKSLVASLEKPEGPYREETKKENEKKFSCIRRSAMPACYFPILYRHFFVENDSQYARVQAVNKFLYRALKIGKRWYILSFSTR